MFKGYYNQTAQPRLFVADFFFLGGGRGGLCIQFDGGGVINTGTGLGLAH